MEIAGRGRILFWEGASLWLMEALPSRGDTPNSTASHSHHAIQITLSLGGRFTLRSDGYVVSGNAAVAPDREHVFEAVGKIAILFVEPESRSGRAIAKNVFKGAPLAAIPEGLIDDLVQRLLQVSADCGSGEQAFNKIGDLLIDRLAGLTAADLPDIRVRKMIGFIQSRLDDAITLASAAKCAGLSPGRARHLFVEQTGLPFRTYLLWLRISKAVEVISAGRSLTEAAHEAGFADSAHFSRTFRRMFGLPAAALQIT